MPLASISRSGTQKGGHLSPRIPAPLSDGQTLTVPRGVGMVGRCIAPPRARVCECQWVRIHCAPPVPTIDSSDNEQWSRGCKLRIAALAYLVSNTPSFGANDASGGGVPGWHFHFQRVRKCVLSAPPPRQA